MIFICIYIYTNTNLGAHEHLLVLGRQVVEGGLHVLRAEQQGIALGLDVSEAQRLRDETLRAPALDVVDYRLSRMHDTKKKTFTHVSETKQIVG